MKKLLYFVYAFFFRLGRLLPQKANGVALVSPHNASFTDSLGCLKKMLESDGGYEILLISHANGLAETLSFMTVKAAALARCSKVFLNDNFMPMSSLNFRKGTLIVQLWHAEGAFKKFGLDIEQPPDIRAREKKGNEKLTYVVCSGEKVRDIYASAFGIDKERVLPLGSPRTDCLINSKNSDTLKAAFLAEHPECVGKKLVLYAPTFRDSPAADKKLLDSFDTKKFSALLGDEYALMIRLHPQIHSAASQIFGAVDVTDCECVNDLTLISDVLITDYSSICMDFALLGKPCFFYAFDLAEYEAKRPLYFNYKAYVPGAVAGNFNELLDLLSRGENAPEKVKKFVDFNFDRPDGKSTQRVFERFFRVY